ncbi:hypothetical protein CVT24_012314 [Panaeolus cyanescens]|uniref:Uncharacterized protein n=1 Tax=Panaeolus cyanescens TaxID=181874 RepID=A0A409W466_9AGAR|nr:hypothetical protein CVT24_012314 [Panaeolus cyanescens]
MQSNIFLPLFSHRFFENKGAVAGVFTVVGLIGLALLVALVTNAVRRRRARKFDRELAEATAAAAAAPAPAFLDDEDEYDKYNHSNGYNRGGGGGMYGAAEGGYGGGYNGGGGFSDVSSHGTYNQPPMSVGHESYGMREMGGGGPVGVGEIYDGGYGAAGVGAAGMGVAGAAGIGVARARSMKNPGDGAYASALQDGSVPYAAFAAGPSSTSPPPGQGHRSQTSNLDILEAAGMGQHVHGAGAGLARGQSQGKNAYAAYPSQVQPQQAQLYHRGSPSQDWNQGQQGGHGVDAQSYSTHSTHYSGQTMAGQALGGFNALGGQQQQPAMPQQAQVYYPPGHSAQQQGYQHGQGYGQQQPHHGVVEEEEDDAYGGYVADAGPAYPSGVAFGAYHPPGGAGGVATATTTGSGSAPTSGNGVSTSTAPSSQPSVYSDKMPNPFDKKGGGQYVDDDVESVVEPEPRRVLKVANE